MRILADLLHPAHVHVFKNFLRLATARGDEVAITARHKEVTTQLLDAYGFEYEVLSSQREGTVGLATEWATRTPKLGRIARRFKPDVMIGIMGVSIAPVGRILRVPSVVFYDTEVAKRTNAVVYPLATNVVTPDCYEGERRSNQTTYAGYHELAYLHPNRFVPDPNRLAAYGLDADRSYAVVRFVGQDSSHDGDEVAIGDDAKASMVSALAQAGSVVVSSERSLPASIRQYRLEGPVEDIHHVLAQASVVVGESATMASEAAVVGTPSIFLGQTSRGYVNELADRYGLIDRRRPAEWRDATDAAVALLGSRGTHDASGHDRMLHDKVDVTAWIDTFLEQYR